MYAKLFSSLLTSSVWSEDSDTCKVWITLLALADREGCVFGSMSGLARVAALPVEAVKKAMDIFMAPDPNSQDIARGRDGSRVVALPAGGWQIVNYVYYRDLASAEERREQVRKATRKWRERDKAGDHGELDDHGRSLRSQEISPITREKSDTSEAESYSYSEAESDRTTTTATVFFEITDGDRWEVPKKLLSDLKRIYPLVDVEYELDKASSKVRDGVVPKKTARGMARFLYSWMEREQGRSVPAAPTTRAAGGGKPFIPDESHGHPPMYTGIPSPPPGSEADREKLRKEMEEFENSLPPGERRITKP